MRQQDQIRRRPDGSIDSAHYLALGRHCRSRACRRNGKALLNRAAAILGHRVRGPRDHRSAPTAPPHRVARHPG